MAESAALKVPEFIPHTSADCAPPPVSGILLMEEEKQALLLRQQHTHDPLGELYVTLQSALREAPLLQQLQVPEEVMTDILLWMDISCSETTWDIAEAAGNEYATFIFENGQDWKWWSGTGGAGAHSGPETMLVLTPPKQTKLPNKAYILKRVRYRVNYRVENNEPRARKPLRDNTKLLIVVEVLNPSQVHIPGKGELLYTATAEVKKEDTELNVYPNVQLPCGRDVCYMLYMVYLGEYALSCFQVPRTKDDRLASRFKKNKLSTSSLKYKCGVYHSYDLNTEYMDVYQVFFSHV